ncbi:MAG TPA: hypothetical protein ENN34_07370 [Deltaproteobacteria bacterium]|nr:hypothetical protein [Deltaproteobacteria bacterium]
MADERRKMTRVIWILGGVFVVLSALWIASLYGLLPLNYTVAKTPRELLAFLQSPRDDMRGIRVNKHLLDIGKRPSLQIVQGYGELMYLMRPYRQMQYRARNLTRAEVMDFCTNITGGDLEVLRSRVSEGLHPDVAYAGRINGRSVAIVNATQFTYIVTGLMENPLLLSQVDLAKRLGMDDATVLRDLIPFQERWLDEFLASPAFDARYPTQFFLPGDDLLVTWIKELR